MIYRFEKIRKRIRLRLFSWILIAAWIVRQIVFLRKRSGREYDVIDKFALLQLIIVAFVTIQLLMMTKDNKFYAKYIRLIKKSSLKYYLLFLLLSIFMSFYSYSFLYSAYMPFEICVTFLLVMLLMARYPDFDHAEKMFVFSSLFIVLLQVFTLLYRGVDLHTNSYSITAAVVAIYSLAEVLTAKGKRKRFLGYVFVVSFMVMMLGTSTGSNISFICGFVVLTMFLGRKQPSSIFVIGLFVALLFASVGVNEILKHMFPGKSLEFVLSARNRIGLWTRSYDLFLENPFYGYGFGVGTKEIFSLKSAHNVFLDVLLGTGVLGFIFFSLYLIAAVLEANPTEHRFAPGSLGYFAAILVFFINNNSAPVIGVAQSPIAISFYALVGLFLFHIKRPGNPAPSQSDVAQKMTNNIDRRVPLGVRR